MAGRLTEVRLDLAGGWVDRTLLLEWAAECRPQGSVMLVTLQGARFGRQATRVALEATTESGRSLVIANIVRLSCPPSGPAAAPAALCDPAAQANLLSLQVHCVQIRTASPSAALLEFAAECQPSLVVLGAHPAAAPARDRKAYDKLTRALSGMPCLIWHPRWAGQPTTEADGQRRRPGPESIHREAL
jgi:hypothetical protein